MILISACLMGYPCKYSGKSNFNPSLMKSLKNEILMPVCPECASGLGTPRNPCEISGGKACDVLAGRAKIIDNQGRDCTAFFLAGAVQTLKIAKNAHIHLAVLKKNSPSCGCGTVYDGTFQGKLVKGNGLTSELLLQNGIQVMNEKQYIMGGENFESN